MVYIDKEMKERVRNRMSNTFFGKFFGKSTAVGSGSWFLDGDVAQAPTILDG